MYIVNDIKRHTNTLKYNNYEYLISKEINECILPALLGNVESFDFLTSSKDVAIYEAEDGMLYLTNLRTNISVDDIDKLPDEYRDNMSVNLREFPKLVDVELKMCEVYEIIFSNIRIPCPYTGKVIGRQYYVDEVLDGAHIHDNESVFSFADGMLCMEDSNVCMNDEKYISQFVWEEGVDHTAREGAYESEHGKVFFYNPIGTYKQQDMLFSRCINYMKFHYLREELIDDLLKYPKPILRAEMMFQQGNNLPKFEKKTYDLPLLAIQNLDVELISKLYDYIQFEDYEKYPEWMLEELFAKYDTSNEVYDMDKCVEIIGLFIEKRLKCSNADEIVSRLTQNLTTDSLAGFIRLLEKLK